MGLLASSWLLDFDVLFHWFIQFHRKSEGSPVGMPSVGSSAGDWRSGQASKEVGKL